MHFTEIELTFVFEIIPTSNLKVWMDDKKSKHLFSQSYGDCIEAFFLNPHLLNKMIAT